MRFSFVKNRSIHGMNIRVKVKVRRPAREEM